jgi:CBS domain-containing protein
MRVSEAMTRDVRVARPSQTIQQAARLMADIDSGILPVGDDDRLIGMITDRDIALRAIGAGKGPDTLVKDVMTEEVKYCFEDEDLNHISRNLGDEQLRRLPVVNRDKRLVGILSLADIALQHNSRSAGRALEGISQPGGRHTQA